MTNILIIGAPGSGKTILAKKMNIRDEGVINYKHLRDFISIFDEIYLTTYHHFSRSQTANKQYNQEADAWLRLHGFQKVKQENNVNTYQKI